MADNTSLQFIIEYIKNKIENKEDVVVDNPLDDYFDIILKQRTEILKVLLNDPDSLTLIERFSWCLAWCKKDGINRTEEDISYSLDLTGLFTYIRIGIPVSEVPELRVSILNVLKKWVEDTSKDMMQLPEYGQYGLVADKIYIRYQNDKRFKMYFDAAKAGNYL